MPKVSWNLADCGCLMICSTVVEKVFLSWLPNPWIETDFYVICFRINLSSKILNNFCKFKNSWADIQNILNLMIKSSNFIFKSVIQYICNIINSLQTQKADPTDHDHRFANEFFCYRAKKKKKIYFADVEAATDNWMFLIQIEIICPHIKYWCSLYDDKCGSRHTNQPKNAIATRWHTEKHRRNMHSIRNTKKISNSFCRTLDIPTMCILLWK